MEFFASIIDFILNINIHLGEIITRYGTLSYAILFIIIFAETGFVFTPFLPGDSLLFAAGAFAAIGSFNVVGLLLLLWTASILGDTMNYWIGHYFGKKIIKNPRIPIQQDHINKTKKLFDKHGGKAIFLARFIPIIRTFAPFVAGIGKMDYVKFLYYNISGGFVWIFGFILLGYFFGNIPSVKENFSILIILIIIISVLPLLIAFVKEKLSRKKSL